MKNVKIISSCLAALLLAMALFTPAGVFAQDGTPVTPADETKGNVTLNPGYVNGNVSIGDVGKNTVTVWKAMIRASGKDAAGNALYGETWIGPELGTYNLTLHVPDEVWKTGGTQEYKVSCYVYYGDKNYYLRFKDQYVNVGYAATQTLDFELKPPGYITGTVSVGCKTLSWGKLYARLNSGGNFVESNIPISADGKIHFPVQPNAAVKVFGTVYMTDGWVYELEARYPDIAAGSETAVNWDLLPTPCSPPCYGSVSGNVELMGLKDDVVHHQWVQVNGATFRNQDINGNDYSFEGLQCGVHDFWARTYLNYRKNGDSQYDDHFYHPYANAKTGINLGAEKDVIADVKTKTAFVNGQITMGERTVVTIPEDACWDTFITGNGVKGSADGGWSRDQVNISDGTYDLILSEGNWDIYTVSLHFKNAECKLCDADNPRYVNASLSIDDYPRMSSNLLFESDKDIPSLTAGQTVADHHFSYETGAVTFKFYVKGGGRLKSPYITGGNSDDAERKANVAIKAYGRPEESTEGEVTFIALPGKYTVIPRATAADGTDVTFGEQTIYVVAGACKVFEAGAPTVTLESPASYSVCDSAAGEQIEVSGTVTDENSVTGVSVNGNPVAFTRRDNPDRPNEVSFSTSAVLALGANRIQVTATNALNKTASETRTVQVYEAGVFTVGEAGEVKADWLYDGGMYKGELGIFSLTGMADLEPNSPKFIKEAARRALSQSEEGFVVISDPAEGAKFAGSLGESRDWNSGPYAQAKTFRMKPGDKFATILVPNATLQSLYDDLDTGEAQKMPLFSLASVNPDHGMYIGQLADIDGSGNAFIYEDMNFMNSDRDYNDFIFQIAGAEVCLPLLDDLIDPAKDWRNIGGVAEDISEHIGTAVKPDTLRMSVSLEGSRADLVLYDSQGRFCGKDGVSIPGAAFYPDENGHRSLFLNVPDQGKYRIVLLGAKDETLSCTVRGHRGETEILSEETKSIRINAHRVLRAEVSVSSDGKGMEIAVGEFETPVSEDGKLLYYDFDGDGKTDDSDIGKVSSRWNAVEGDEDYDPFYDLDEDGYIGILDIMPAVSSKSVP